MYSLEAQKKDDTQVHKKTGSKRVFRLETGRSIGPDDRKTDVRRSHQIEVRHFQTNNGDHQGDDVNYPKTIYQPTYQALVTKLQRLRVAQRLRQADVGDRLGVTRHWVRKVESCQQRLDLVQFVRLCQVYGVSASRLLRRLEEASSDEDDVSLPIRAASQDLGTTPNPAIDGFLFCKFWQNPDHCKIETKKCPDGYNRDKLLQ